MRTLLLLAFLFYAFLGWWKIPSTLGEARSPLAPYRALSGVIYLAIAAFFYLLWCFK